MSKENLAWFLLILAGLCETVWPFGYQWSDGLKLSKLWPWGFLAILLLVVSFILMGRAAKVLPMGTVYAVWTGMGAVGVSVIGMVFFKEPRDVARILCLTLVVIGVIGLKYFSGVVEAQHGSAPAAAETRRAPE